MTSFRAFLLSVGLASLTVGILDARIVVAWSDEKLLGKSDLAVIAVPAATRDTPERGPLPGDERQPVIGVQTDFSVLSVLKGHQETALVTLHHYRPDRMEVPNAPSFVSFDPKGARAYRLYLVRQADGLYAPTAGQEDPGLSIREEYTPPPRSADR